ncbi:MAG TPA: TonB-dependent receptor [Vicinamibacterales bacterium]|nr:TonB-dependent receptor [Vicinamibacterales bacterium]
MLVRLFVGLSLLIAPAAAIAQVQSGSVLVKLADEQGGVVPGATVTITGATLITPMVGTTDALGAYRAPSLAPGHYAVKVELTGFQTMEHPDVIVSVGQTASFDVVMKVAPIRASFTIQAAVPTIDTTSNNVSTTINLGILMNTPGGRDIWSLLQSKASGLTTDRIDVGGSESGLQAGFVVHGTPHAQNTQALNGVNVSDPVSTGFADFYYDYDTFQEVQVATGALPVEVGPPGVYVNMVTKTGTNVLKGHFAFYYQNDKTQSDNIDQELRDKGIEKLGFDYLSDFTAQVGGPVIKDRLRLFAAYRDWRVHRFVAGFVDDQGTPVVEPTDMYSGLVNATYQITPTQRLTGFWARQAYKKPQREASALNTPLSNWNEDDEFGIYQGIWNNILNDHAYLEARASFVDIFFPLRIKDEAKAAGNQSITNFNTGKVTGANTAEIINDRKRLQLNTVLSWYKAGWVGARHEFKFGWDFSNSPTAVTLTAIDDVNLFTLDGAPAFAVRLNTPVHPEETVRSNAFFASDTIQKGRLTVNFGGRFERIQGIVPAQSSPAGSFAEARSFPSLGTIVDWKSFSPRGGVIYQLTADGKTAVKVNGARYFHQMSTAIPSSANPNSAAGDVVLWFDNGDFKFQPNEAGPVIDAFGALRTSIDPDLKPPFTDEFLLTLEREVMPDFRLSGIFSFRRERRQVGIKDVTSTWTPVAFPDPETGRTVNVFNKAPESIGLEQFQVINSAQLDQDFKGFEIIANKRLSNRWELLGSYSVSRAIQEQVVVPGGDIFGIGAISVDPNDAVNARGPIFWDRTHVLKLSGSYLLPHDILASANLLVQSGPVFTRTVLVEGLNLQPFAVFAEPREDSGRLDTLKTLDLRGSKQFKLPRNRTFEALVEVYNLFNSNTVLNANPLTGPAFGDPLTVLAPRIVRFGGRFLF